MRLNNGSKPNKNIRDRVTMTTPNPQAHKQRKRELLARMRAKRTDRVG